jgi:hypothetical protein
MVVLFGEQYSRAGKKLKSKRSQKQISSFFGGSSFPCRRGLKDVKIFQNLSTFIG